MMNNSISASLTSIFSLELNRLLLIFRNSIKHFLYMSMELQEQTWKFGRMRKAVETLMAGIVDECQFHSCC